MKGRTPAPDSIKKLRGNPGKRKLNNAIDLENAIPDPPGWLIRPAARAEWVRLTGIMFDAGLITQLDAGLLGSACWLHGEIDHHIEAMKDEPEFYTGRRGAPTPNPRTILIRQYLQLYTKSIADLGFSPTQRPRVKPNRTAAEKTPRSTLASNLFGMHVQVKEKKAAASVKN